MCPRPCVSCGLQGYRWRRRESLVEEGTSTASRVVRDVADNDARGRAEVVDESGLAGLAFAPRRRASGGAGFRLLGLVSGSSLTRRSESSVRPVPSRARDPGRIAPSPAKRRAGDGNIAPTVIPRNPRRWASRSCWRQARRVSGLPELTGDTSSSRGMIPARRRDEEDHVGLQEACSIWFSMSRVRPSTSSMPNPPVSTSSNVFPLWSTLRSRGREWSPGRVHGWPLPLAAETIQEGGFPHIGSSHNGNDRHGEPHQHI